MTASLLCLALSTQLQAPSVGMATLHLAMPQVLASYPDRRCSGCDGYIAVERCEDVGKDYVLLFQGRSYRVRAADCMAAKDRIGMQARYLSDYGLPWLVDIGATRDLSGLLWGDTPIRPLPAALIPVGDFSPC